MWSNVVRFGAPTGCNMGSISLLEQLSLDELDDVGVVTSD
jgi:hypothetical protein